MIRKRPVRLATAAAAVLLLGIGSGGQISVPSDEFQVRTFFSVRSALPDASVPEALRGQFEKDDGSPLRSVPIDIEGDGRVEKFVLCGVPTAAGGYQWLVYDPARGVSRGIVIGAVIFVGRESDNGFPRLETYWKQGGDMSVVSRYAYAGGRYGRLGMRALTLWETSEYFRAKPPLDPDRELAEIK